MKKALAAIFVLSLSLSLAAQSAAPMHVSKSDAKSSDAKSDAKSKDAASSSNSSSSSSSSSSASTKPADLASMLSDAEAAVTATNTDLANLRTDKWASGWKTGFIKKSSHKQQAGQTADTVKQQAGQLPAMISDVRSSHGSVGSTFKLYNSLTLVCENLDILSEATQNYGKKDEYTRLSADYSNLLRVRASLSNYVEQRAAIVDPRGNVVVTSSTSSLKKDDAPPAKKTIAHNKKKKTSVANR